jgi:hypothetical protein
MPWQAVHTDLRVVINNPNIESAYLLDQNGYEVREVYVGKDEGNSSYKEIFVPANGMYVVVDTRPATATSLDLNENDKIKIYPNPNDGMLRIETPAGKSLYNEVEVLSLSGKVLKRFESAQTTYDLNLPDGMYIIKLKLKRKVIKTEKILLSNG